MDRDLEPYWLAGLLEGEGSFLAGPPSSPNCPRVQLPMTDGDVVAHAACLLDRHMWRSVRGRELGFRPVFLTAIKGAGAAQLMTALRPLMGARRRAQIDRALARPHRAVMRWRRKPSACSSHECSLPVYAKGICKIHYQAWWRSKQRGRRLQHGRLDPPAPGNIDRAASLDIPDAETPQAVAWLAGVLEGEGTFEAHRQGTRTYPRISVQMSDEDVIQRVSAVLGSSGVWRQDARRNEWSPMFGTAITGGRAREFMLRVRPFMGARRQSEIEIALRGHVPERVTAISSCIVDGCAAPHDSRGLCHRHHMQWWRDRRRGRVPRVTALR